MIEADNKHETRELVQPLAEVNPVEPSVLAFNPISEEVSQCQSGDSFGIKIPSLKPFETGQKD